VSTDGWIDKKVVYIYIYTHTHTYILIYISTIYTYIYILYNYIKYKYIKPYKEGNSIVWDDMEGPWRHCAKWNKSDRERQILYDFTFMWNLEKQATATGKKWAHRYRQ